MSRQDWAIIVKFGVGSGLGAPVLGAVIFRLLYAISERSWLALVTIPFLGLPEILAVVLFGPVAFGVTALGTWLLLRERGPQRLRLKGIIYGLLLGLIVPPVTLLTLLVIRRTIASPNENLTTSFGVYTVPFELAASITGALVGSIIARKLIALRING